HTGETEQVPAGERHGRVTDVKVVPPARGDLDGAAGHVRGGHRDGLHGSGATPLGRARRVRCVRRRRSGGVPEARRTAPIRPGPGTSPLAPTDAFSWTKAVLRTAPAATLVVTSRRYPPPPVRADRRGVASAACCCAPSVRIRATAERTSRS